MNSTKTKLSCLVLCFVFHFHCTGVREPFSVLPCDNFDSSLQCLEPKKEKETIFLDPKKLSSKITWTDFGNYLYFKAKETPGFVLEKGDVPSVDFQPSNLIAKIEWMGVSQKMEGIRYNKDRIAAFHYLGALIKESTKHRGQENLPVDWSEPVVIILSYSLGKENQGKLIREIRWEWLTKP